MLATTSGHEACTADVCMQWPSIKASKHTGFTGHCTITRFVSSARYCRACGGVKKNSCKNFRSYRRFHESTSWAGGIESVDAGDRRPHREYCSVNTSLSSCLVFCGSTQVYLHIKLVDPLLADHVFVTEEHLKRVAFIHSFLVTSRKFFPPLLQLQFGNDVSLQT